MSPQLTVTTEKLFGKNGTGLGLKKINKKNDNIEFRKKTIIQWKLNFEINKELECYNTLQGITILLSKETDIESE